MYSEATAHRQLLTAKESISSLISFSTKGEAHSVTHSDTLPEGSILQKAISMCLGGCMEKIQAHNVKNLKQKTIQELARFVRQAARGFQNSHSGAFFGNNKVLSASEIIGNK